MRVRLLAATAALVLASSVAAGCRGKSEEAKIRSRLDDAVSSVEQGQVGDAMEWVAEDFTDGHGNDKQTVRGILAGQVLRGNRITVVRRDEKVTVEGEKASLRFDAALFQGDRSKLKGLVPQRSGTYRFTLSLEKRDGDWLVTKGEWQSIPATSFVVNSIGD